jgi:hypothetical protein
MDDFILHILYVRWIEEAGDIASQLSPVSKEQVNGINEDDSYKFVVSYSFHSLTPVSCDAKELFCRYRY